MGCTGDTGNADDIKRKLDVVWSFGVNLDWLISYGLFDIRKNIRDYSLLSYLGVILFAFFVLDWDLDKNVDFLTFF